MTKHIKLGIKEFALIFSALNLIVFLMYFVPYYVLENDEISLAYEYFRLYAGEIILWILPVATAAFLVVHCVKESTKKALSSALLISLPNLVYTLPFYYLLGIEHGSDTPESLGMSLLVSAGYFVIFFVHTLVLYLIIRRSLIFFTAKELSRAMPPKYASNPTSEMWRDCLTQATNTLPEKISEGKALDLSHPTSLAFFFASLFEFTIYFSIEIFNAVSYLVNYSGGYKSGEIAYMIFRFIFVLAMLFLSLAISQIVKRRTRSVDEDRACNQ